MIDFLIDWVLFTEAIYKQYIWLCFWRGCCGRNIRGSRSSPFLVFIMMFSVYFFQVVWMGLFVLLLVFLIQSCLASNYMVYLLRSNFLGWFWLFCHISNQRVFWILVLCCYNYLDLLWEELFQMWVTCFPSYWEQKHCVEKAGSSSRPKTKKFWPFPHTFSARDNWENNKQYEKILSVMKI